MARAPVSKTGGWGFESLHSCQQIKDLAATGPILNALRPVRVHAGGHRDRPLRHRGGRW